MLTASLLMDILPYIAALTADSLEQNLLLHPDAMEDLLSALEPDDPALCWEHQIQPLLTMVRRFGCPMMVDAILRLGRHLDPFTLEQLLLWEEEKRTIALYHAELTWLTTAQLHALLSGGPYDVPDPIEGVSA